MFCIDRKSLLCTVGSAVSFLVGPGQSPGGDSESEAPGSPKDAAVYNTEQ